MIQSLLTQGEYDILSKRYNTYNPGPRRSKPPVRIVKVGGKEFQCGPPPNYIMGDSLTATEIKTINARMIAVMEKFGLSYSIIPDWGMQLEI